MSFKEIIGLPDVAVAFLVSLGVVLAVAPYFRGYDFGIVKFPRLSNQDRRRLRIAGPAYLLILLLTLLPFWSSEKPSDKLSADSDSPSQLDPVELAETSESPTKPLSRPLASARQEAEENAQAEYERIAEELGATVVGPNSPATSRIDLWLIPGLIREDPETSPCMSRGNFVGKRDKRAYQHSSEAGYTYDPQSTKITFYWFCVNRNPTPVFYYFCCSCSKDRGSSTQFHAEHGSFAIYSEPSADYYYSIDCAPTASGRPKPRIARAAT